MKKIFYLLLCIALASCAALLAACGDSNDGATDSSGQDGGDNANQKIAYTVTLTDSNGAPVSNIIVKIMKNGESVAMKPTGADGKAAFNLEADSYGVELAFTGNDSYNYDSGSLALTAESASLAITLYTQSMGSEPLYNGSSAYYVSIGSYQVDFDAEGYTYFLFTPTIAGRYKFSVESETPASVGYYGNPMIIYEHNIADPEDTVDGAVFMDVRSYNIGETAASTTRYLFGVKGDAAGSGIFKVERVSDLEISPEEFPWTDYAKTSEIKPFTFEGGALTQVDVFDITATAVLGDDGYYHYGSADGPVIYLRLTTASPYIASFEEMSETQFFGHYVYDENGKFLYKVSYHSMLLEYIEAAKASGDAGLYPLTNDLAVMLKDMGSFLGWYTPAAPGSEHVLFGDKPITENAWLFACVYVKEN